MKTKLNQKPIDIDLHLKYICPNPDCNQIHWLSLQQAKTKNFKVVCYCGMVFLPKPIQKIKLHYKISQNTQQTTLPKIDLNPETLSTACNSLMQYGFTQVEAIDLIKKAYTNIGSNNSTDLVKEALYLLGATHDNN